MAVRAPGGASREVDGGAVTRERQHAVVGPPRRGDA